MGGEDGRRELQRARLRGGGVGGGHRGVESRKYEPAIASLFLRITSSSLLASLIFYLCSVFR